MAISMARHGAVPVIVDINETKAKEVVQEVGAIGISTMGIKADITMISEIEKMTNMAIQRFGKIDILVNNAGIVEAHPIEDVTEKEWDRVMTVNLRSVFFVSQQVIKHMKENRAGKIINISSISGRMGSYAAGCIYGASKAGIIGLTMSMARKLAEFNITVNAIAPGPHETEMIRSLPKENVAAMKKTIPLGKLGNPENLGEVVSFLSSDAADFITGAVIDVNGGMFMG
jgi:3-oxoacyl-[acyl-carrier protein] reductase